MRILFNCINNVTGGGVQNSANFILYAASDFNNDYCFMVSPQVYQVLNRWGVEHSNIITFDDKNRIFDVQRRVSQIESLFQPDLAFTMAGPSFLRFKCFHILGISNPYITHAPFKIFFKGKSLLSGLRKFVIEKLKGILGRFSSSYIIFQTSTSRDGFCRQFFWAQDRTTIIPNAVGSSFLNDLSSSYSLWSGMHHEEKTVVCPSAYYTHKNIDIIFEVAQLLKSCKITNIKFVLTIPSYQFKNALDRYPGVSDIVGNIGPFNYSNAYKVYEMADAIILPSLLETFSTTYIESMAMGLPLFVPEEEFATSICREYGIYYSSLSAESLFDVILREETEEEIELKEIIRARILQEYGTQEGRFQSFLGLFEQLADRKN